MAAKIVWLGIFAILYIAFCIHRAKQSAPQGKTASDYFIAGRSLAPMVFILAATAATFSGATFLAQPAHIYASGFPYAFTSLYAITIPLAGLLVMRRQWMLGKRFGYVTPGEMLSDYFGSGVLRLLILAIAVCIAIPFLGLQLFASGVLLNTLSDGLVPIRLGAAAMAALLLVYVLWGGLRGVAYVAIVQALLLILGIALVGAIALMQVGGWSRLIDGMAALGSIDTTRTAQGFSHYLAVSDFVQFDPASTQLLGGSWTVALIFTYTIVLMGIQCSPTFSMWALASKDPRPFAFQQVWASAFLVGLVVIIFSAAQGFAGHFLGADTAFTDRFPEFAHTKLRDLLQNQYGATDLTQLPTGSLVLVPLLIDLIVSTAPWLVGLLAICGLSAMHSTAASYMSTTGSMLSRDLVKCYMRPDASDATQILYGRIAAGIILLAALLAAIGPVGLLVLLGSVAVAAAAQMLPALIGLCYAPRLTAPAVIAGMLFGLATALATEPFGRALGITEWSRWPLTVHSAFWGLAVNTVTVVLISVFTQNKQGLARRRAFHTFLQQHAGLTESKRRLAPLAWIFVVIWFFFAIGPGLMIGNTLFGNPNDAASWLFGLPSIWLWQLLWWALGVFMLWFLAYRMGLSALPNQPVEPLAVDFGATGTSEHEPPGNVGEASGHAQN